MKDMQSYFRYILPSLVFFVELILYFLLSSDRYTVLNYFHSLLVNGSLGNAIIILSGLLASGGLGFIFGVIYYAFVWRSCYSSNFNDIVDYAVNNNLIIFNNYKDNIKLVNQKKRSYLIVNSVIDHSKANTNFKYDITRMKRLADVSTSLGTICIASISALAAWLLITLCIVSRSIIFKDTCVIVIAVVLIILHFINFKHAIRDHQALAGFVFLNILKNKNTKNNQTLEYYIIDNDKLSKKERQLN